VTVIKVAPMTLDYLSHLRTESARFAGVLRATDPAAPVPSCPDWTADDLLWHLAEVFFFWGTVVRDRLDDPDPADAATPARPSHRAALLAVYDGATAALLHALATTPDDVAVWSWSTDGSAGFVRRRMAHEALIHRVDAELTAGVAPELDPALATDGVHEALQHFYGGHPGWATYEGSGPTGRVRTSDTRAEWLVQVGGFSGLSPNTGKTYDGEPTLELLDAGTPSFTVSATAADLDSWIWNRPPRVEPTVEGDRADFGAFAALVAKGVD
jgi:uncharacterized protein (TIGR03083 family)